MDMNIVDLTPCLKHTRKSTHLPNLVSKGFNDNTQQNIHCMPTFQYIKHLYRHDHMITGFTDVISVIITP